MDDMQALALFLITVGLIGIIFEVVKALGLLDDWEE